MGRKKKLPFTSLFKKPNPKPLSSSSSCHSSSHFSWPSCGGPKTLSFRLLSNTTHSEPYSMSDLSTHEHPCNSSSSTTADDSTPAAWSAEAVMQAKKSNRLLFDTCSSSSTTLIKKKRRGGGRGGEGGLPLEGSIAVEMESVDLYGDFRVSMKGMVEAYKEGGGGGGEMRWMEEMLGWYLRVNKKTTHEFIIRAYWDLLLEMMGYSLSAATTTASSPCSSDSYFSCNSEFEEMKECM